MDKYTHLIFNILLYLLLITINIKVVFAAQTECIRIAYENRARAVIVIDKLPSKRLSDAAHTLADYLLRSTGARFTITDKPILSLTQIRLTTANSNMLKDRSGFPVKDAFTVDFPDKKTIRICGNSDIGTEFAVNDFLERYLGVRWLFPGEIGTHVPLNKTLDIPIKNVSEKPRYLMRRFGDLRDKEEIQWATRNRRFDAGIKYGHNLVNLFPPDVYGKSTPELYPILKGKRVIPKTNDRVSWQPCFSEPKLVYIAIKNM